MFNISFFLLLGLAISIIYKKAICLSYFSAKNYTNIHTGGNNYIPSYININQDLHSTYWSIICKMLSYSC